MSILPPAPKLFKNALVLMLGQVLSAPLAFVNSLIIARSLGAKEFGLLYLVGNVCNFGFLVVEWGQATTVTGSVARNPERGGEILGSGVAWRVGVTPAVYLAMAVGARWLQKDPEFQSALALFTLVLLSNTVFGALQDTLRGFDRMDVIAFGAIGQQLFNLAFVGGALLLGGRLNSVLLAQTAAAVVLALFMVRALPPLVRGSTRVRWETVRELLNKGAPFFSLNVALALEPLIDAVFLAKLAPEEAMGWFSVASKLIGGLIFPANALGTASYPSWARMWTQDRAAFAPSVSSGLRASLVIVMPIGLGCLLYPDIGVSIFSHKSFGPASADIRILSFFLFAFYLTRLTGAALAAADRGRAWSIVQFVCPVVSLIADPFLIPYFQNHYGNGGLGVCIVTSANEVLLIAASVFLCPKGVFNRRLVRTLLLAMLAGAAMCGMAFVTSRLPLLVGAFASVVAYGACLWATGGLDEALVANFKQALGRRFQRRAPEQPGTGST